MQAFAGLRVPARTSNLLLKSLATMEASLTARVSTRREQASALEAAASILFVRFCQKKKKAVRNERG